MALNDLLAGLRELILNEQYRFDDRTQIKERLLAQHPNLSKSEIADLSALPQERLSLYTKSIYANQRKVISRRLSLSVYLLEYYLTNISKQSFVLLEFVKKMYQKHPWRGNKTVTLLQNFIDSCQERFPDLLQSIPYFTDIANFELAKYILIRDPYEVSAKKQVEFDLDLVTCTVTELLSHSCRVNFPFTLLTSKYDIQKIIDNIKTDEFDYATNYQLESRQAFLVFRNSHNELRHLILSEYIDWLMELKPGKKIYLDDIVEKICPGSESELEQFFQRFISDLLTIQQAGLISLIN